MDTTSKLVPVLLAVAIASIGWPEAAFPQENPTTPGAIPQPWTYQGSMEMQSQGQPEPAQPQYEAPTYSAPSYGGSAAAPASRAEPVVPISKDPATAAFNRGDYATAARLVRADALKGDANAQKNLGYLYAEGLGVPRDPAQALAWYQKAADQGYAPAYNNLGIMYADGFGVRQDLVQAYLFFIKAWETGDAEDVRLAITNRDHVVSLMSHAQFSEAVRQEQALHGQ
jgi:TPR repeat protein